MMMMLVPPSLIKPSCLLTFLRFITFRPQSDGSVTLCPFQFFPYVPTRSRSVPSPRRAAAPRGNRGAQRQLVGRTRRLARPSPPRTLCPVPRRAPQLHTPPPASARRGKDEASALASKREKLVFIKKTARRHKRSGGR